MQNFLKINFLYSANFSCTEVVKQNLNCEHIAA